MTKNMIKKMQINPNIQFSLMFAEMFIELSFAVFIKHFINYLNADKKTNIFLYGIFILLLLFSIKTIVLIIKRTKKNKTENTIYEMNPIVFSLFLSFLTFALEETCSEGLIFKPVLFYLMGFIMNSVLIFFCVLPIKKSKIPLYICETFYVVYGLTQHFVYFFRGAPARFSDLKNINDAVMVIGMYKLSFDFTIIIVILQIISIYYLISKVQFEVSGKARIISVFYIVCALSAFFALTDFSYNYGIRNKDIDMNFSTEVDSMSTALIGNLLNFYYDAKFNRLTVPKDYSIEKAESLYSDKAETIAYDKPDDSAPIIIAILNESYADYSHIQEFNTNTDYLSSWRSLNENTIKGYVTVSAYGGNTCNSEYEFLTGNSMYFLPTGSAVFTNYFHDSQDSIVSILKDYNYETVAATPGPKDLWDIGRVYPLLGFDKMLYDEDLKITETINRQPADKELYKKIDELIVNRNKEKGLFIYTKTIQNHAQYTVNVDGGLQLTDINDIEAERYLNSLKLSDEAVGDFLNHLKDYDEKIVVVMFGDHYPHIPTFSKQLYDGKNIAFLNTEELSLIQQTPFFIWSNKEMESDYIEDISLNYLSLETMKAANLPLTSYMNKLDEYKNDVPIISGFGIKGSDGVWYSKDDSRLNNSPYNEILNEYHILQYYRMFKKQ